MSAKGQQYLGRTVGALAVTLFLLGSNYCLLSTWSGAPSMACMSLPAVSNTGPSSSHCGHDADRTEGKVPGGSSSTISCCVSIVVPGAPQLAPIVSGAAPLAPAAVAAIAGPRPAPAFHRHRATARDGPQSAGYAAAEPARAPPLS